MGVEEKGLPYLEMDAAENCSLYYYLEFKMYAKATMTMNCTSEFRSSAIMKKFKPYNFRYRLGAESDLYFVNTEDKTILCLTPSTSGYYVEVATDLQYSRKMEKVLEEYKAPPVEDKSFRIYLMSKTLQGYRLRGSVIKTKSINVGLNYGSDFAKVDHEITTKLNDGHTGLVLLHGVPGTGKTSYIRQLVRQVTRRVVLVPNHLLRELSSPEMIDFILDTEGMVLVLEDAELAIKSRDVNSQGAVAELLNLSDGLLGSAINCSVVVTFNTHIDNIDAALLRKGRLLQRYEFKELNVEDSNKLLAHLGKDYKTQEPMTLADIYNLEVPVLV